MRAAAPIIDATIIAAMDKPLPRRQLRRTAWWVAFAALAGFLLADLT